MTRRRFIKILMSKGETRNDANTIANILQLHGTPYLEYIEDVYWKVEEMIRSWKEGK